MYWGLVLKSNKRYSQQVIKGFHVSNATLDLSTIEADANVSVWVHTDEQQHLLCNLSKQIPQVPLDLMFSEGETVAFFTKGNGVVHLNSNIMQEDEFGGMDDLGDEEQDEEEGIENEQMRIKKLMKSQKKNSKKVDNEDNDDSEDEDEGAEDEEDSEDGENSDSDDDEEEDEDEGQDDDEDDDEDEDDDDDSDSDEVSAPPAKQAKLDKQAKPQNGLQNGKAQPKQNQQVKKQKEQPKKDQPQQQQQKTGKKTLSSGVVIEDMRHGKGSEAAPGKTVTVYYTGRLQKTNKVFDSATSGPGFKFKLGKGEVIKAWDIGVAGMRIGGKRRIICPPHVAYGPKGSPPVIPPNATLVFDVELRNV